MKTEQKAEMTKEEFAEKYKTTSSHSYMDDTTGLEIHVQNNIESLLSDLRSVIRGELIRYDKWCTNQLTEKIIGLSTEELVDDFLNNNQ